MDIPNHVPAPFPTNNQMMAPGPYPSMPNNQPPNNFPVQFPGQSQMTQPQISAESAATNGFSRILSEFILPAVVEHVNNLPPGQRTTVEDLRKALRLPAPQIMTSINGGGGLQKPAIKPASDKHAVRSAVYKGPGYCCHRFKRQPHKDWYCNDEELATSFCPTHYVSVDAAKSMNMTVDQAKERKTAILSQNGKKTRGRKPSTTSSMPPAFGGGGPGAFAGGAPGMPSGFPPGMPGLTSSGFPGGAPLPVKTVQVKQGADMFQNNYVVLTPQSILMETDGGLPKMAVGYISDQFSPNYPYNGNISPFNEEHVNWLSKMKVPSYDFNDAQRIFHNLQQQRNQRLNSASTFHQMPSNNSLPSLTQTPPSFGGQQQSFGGQQQSFGGQQQSFGGVPNLPGAQPSQQSFGGAPNLPGAQPSPQAQQSSFGGAPNLPGAQPSPQAQQSSFGGAPNLPGDQLTETPQNQ